MSRVTSERGMMGIRGDATKAQWESSNFPIVCETCLGDNPYVRMQREKFGQACKICDRPFTVFRFRPGGSARYKKTQLCQQCSKTKNVCQVCILDLTYGLPVEVRDTILAKQQQHQAITVPTGAANRAYFFSQQAQLQAASGGDGHDVYSGGSASGGVGSSAHAQLLKLAQRRKAPYYKRNLPHICSFYVKGECNRGSSCPYRHEMPPTKKDDPLAKQNMKDRFNGVDDPVAKKMLARASESSRIREPKDDSVTTVWLGGVSDRISDGDLREVFYHFGEIRGINMVPQKTCAFVEFVTHDAAHRAIQKMHGNCTVKGVSLAVNWANRSRSGVFQGPPREVQQHMGTFITREGAAAAPSRPLTDFGAVAASTSTPAIPDAFRAAIAPYKPPAATAAAATTTPAAASAST